MKPTTRRPPSRSVVRRRSGQYAWAAGVVGLATAVGLALRAFLSTTDMAMLYLLAAVVIGSRVRQRPALFASVLSIAAFDFCFVPPFYTFAVHDITYVLTFAMMLAITIIMSRLTGRIREQADASRAREQRTASAFALSRELAAAREPPEIVAAATRHIEDAFAGRVAFLLADPGGGVAGGGRRRELDLRPRPDGRPRHEHAPSVTGALPSAAGRRACPRRGASRAARSARRRRS